MSVLSVVCLLYILGCVCACECGRRACSCDCDKAMTRAGFPWVQGLGQDIPVDTLQTSSNSSPSQQTGVQGWGEGHVGQEAESPPQAPSSMLT